MPESSDLTAYFADDYFAARDRFLNLTCGNGWSVASHEIAAKGPAGQPLFIDVATKPGTGAAAGRTVIVSSGLHGVEGFLGSAVQGAALDNATVGNRGSSDLPRLVFIHALNPFGFAWIRRCNEDNVDLNRNFLPAGAPYRGVPLDYAKLDWLLNKRAPPSRREPFRLLSLLAILRYGLPRLKRAIAAGQYEFPLGLFYGGHDPCETTRFVENEFGNWIGDDAGDVIHLDFHTGLGPSGEFQLLSDVLPAPDRAARLRSRFQHDIRSGQQSASVSYTARGSIGEWCQTAAANRDYQYLCVEFGTYPPVKVLAALRTENQAQHWDRPGTATYRWAKEQLKVAFCPSSPGWRATALSQGVELIRRALQFP